MNGFVVELRAEIARRVGQEPGGESAWIAEAVREKPAACAEPEDLDGHTAQGSQEAFARISAKVPAVEPMPGDEL